MSGLIRYDAACRALAEAKTVDEVKDIRDRAAALSAYARQAKNKELEADAAEIRLRAERRVGELMAAQKESVGMASGREGKRRSRGIENPENKPTLADAGIDKNLAKQARKLVAMDEVELANVIAETRAAVNRVGRKVVSQKIKKADRDAREAALASAIMELPEEHFGVIYADPPWRVEAYSRETGLNKAPDNHYPTMTTEEICRIDGSSIVANNCVLFLWATTTMLADAMRVMEHWGFAYKTHFVWKKIRPGKQTGTGYWNRNQHEILLLGVRGCVPAPVPGTQWDSLIEAPVGRHSEKPEKFYEMVEAYFPNLPKIELFARRKRDGWSAYGSEKDGPLCSDVERGSRATQLTGDR